MVVLQGDIFWMDLGVPSKSEPGFRRPFVVIQNNLFNRSPINTTVVCALTSHAGRAGAPGNVVLRKGEGNLPRSSAVNITQILTVDKRDLGSKLGTLSSIRVREIVDGLRLLTEPRDLE